MPSKLSNIEAAAEKVQNLSEDMNVDDDNTQAGMSAAYVREKCSYRGVV